MDEVTAAQQQDALRPLRVFISSLNTAFYGDQAYAGADSNVSNAPRQFTTVGPYGTAVEGQPIALTKAGGVALSPLVVWGLVAVAAFWLGHRKG